jgi:hypothetical protein
MHSWVGGETALGQQQAVVTPVQFGVLLGNDFMSKWYFNMKYQTR